LHWGRLIVPKSLCASDRSVKRRERAGCTQNVLGSLEEALIRIGKIRPLVTEPSRAGV